MKQQNLFKKLPQSQQVSLGGRNIKSHAKRARPLAPKATYHIVLYSDKARGELSLLAKKHRNLIEKIVYRQARKFYVRVEGFANVGNHLHIKAYIQSREEFRHFLRSITCLIARLVTGARRGKKFGRFWKGLAFTRLVKTWTEKVILSRYIFANRLEGMFNRQTRDAYLALWYG